MLLYFLKDQREKRRTGSLHTSSEWPVKVCSELSCHQPKTNDLMGQTDCLPDLYSRQVMLPSVHKSIHAAMFLSRGIIFEMNAVTVTALSIFEQLDIFNPV